MAAAVERLVFALNGRRYEVAAGDVDPSTRLVEFIRTRTPFKGTKIGCGEGTYVSVQMFLAWPWLHRTVPPVAACTHSGRSTCM
jgi:abscisic-aldehyde oxidase